MHTCSLASAVKTVVLFLLRLGNFGQAAMTLLCSYCGRLIILIHAAQLAVVCSQSVDQKFGTICHSEQD